MKFGRQLSACLAPVSVGATVWAAQDDRLRPHHLAGAHGDDANDDAEDDGSPCAVAGQAVGAMS